MSFGGGHPYPRKMGGGPSRVQQLLAAISADRGDLYTTDTNSIVYVENMALARAVSGAWGTNERLGNLWQPHRTSEDVLSRWETILVLRPPYGMTMTERRRRVEDRLTLVAEGIRGVVLDRMVTLGPAFLSVDYIDIAFALITVPDGTYPFGVVDADKPWSSTVARVLVRLQKPAGYVEANFYDVASQAIDLIDPLMPAWLEIDW